MRVSIPRRFDVQSRNSEDHSPTRTLDGSHTPSSSRLWPPMQAGTLLRGAQVRIACASSSVRFWRTREPCCTAGRTLAEPPPCIQLQDTILDRAFVSLREAARISARSNATALRPKRTRENGAIKSPHNR